MLIDMEEILKIIKEKGKGIFHDTKWDRMIGDYLNDKPKRKQSIFHYNGKVQSYNYKI